MFDCYTSILKRLGYSHQSINDFISVLQQNYLKKINIVRPFITGRALLDISTGYGTFLSMLITEFPFLDFFSLDLSISSILSFRSPSAYSPFFVVANAFLLPFRSHSFDIILSHNATHDLILNSFSEEDFFSAFFSSLRSGGTFIVIDKVTDHFSINSFDYQIETLQHYLYKLANIRVFGLRKSRDLEKFISRFSSDYHMEIVYLDSHPLLLPFAKSFYNKKHWQSLLTLVPPSKRSLAEDLITDFIQKLNSNYFNDEQLPAAVFVGTS